ncbi:Uncharacterized conserved protein, DUF885 familyt [Saccharopolyspora kobensis]|uniref:Uncharacterized conserved protein, DUF885 familyt n=1 Tax=Saccharopolyspora kobensis TaxID=146035 RepID=A0A1H5UIY0_9PSEU|nr:DUF885 domain-containing protein [Saccharopolyspora kobensis]SEF74994.1 Uncharacterized conserved protein, DUF885 familyt [Saccharopolyspora kobensis]SFC72834.1 Uncharacterized conserved protein, DUF885 familyt [Saccharopolyspora kobensis]
MTTVTRLADELLALLHREDPLAATALGVGGHDHELPDLSESGERARKADAGHIARRASGLGGLGEQESVTRAVVVQQAMALVARVDARLVEHTVAFQLTSPAGALLHGLAQVRPVGDDAERAYLDRLAAIPAYLAVAAERHRAGAAAGRLPVAYLGCAAVASLDRYLAGPDPLRGPALSGSRVAERERLLDGVVREAFARYREVIDTELVPCGRPEEQPGLCWLPDGGAVYEALSRVHTTTERGPEDLHRTGLELIDELAAEYVEIGSRVFGATTADEVRERLRADPALRWESPEEVLSTARGTVERAEQAAAGWFRRVPAGRCAVRPVPDNEAPNVSAYYNRPALDGSRPGTYFANTYRAEEREKVTAEAVAFHEAVPGHHFQLALAQEAEGLPMLRSLADINAYVEGWALYAERLADEMGLYSGDLARLGMLAEDSLRAARLVVDTGLHARGWTRRQAVDFMLSHTLLSEVDVHVEVDRYVEWPGQALSYMVGRLEIQRLRAGAERALGTAFDLAAFHDLVLTGGPLPMTVLAEVVENWAPWSTAVPNTR